MISGHFDTNAPPPNPPPHQKPKTNKQTNKTEINGKVYKVTTNN